MSKFSTRNTRNPIPSRSLLSRKQERALSCLPKHPIGKFGPQLVDAMLPCHPPSSLYLALPSLPCPALPVPRPVAVPGLSDAGNRHVDLIRGLSCYSRLHIKPSDTGHPHGPASRSSRSHLTPQDGSPYIYKTPLGPLHSLTFTRLSSFLTTTEITLMLTPVSPSFSLHLYPSWRI